MTKKTKKRLLEIQEELIIIQQVNQEMLDYVKNQLEETPYLYDLDEITRNSGNAVKPIEDAVSRLQSSSS